MDKDLDRKEGRKMAVSLRDVPVLKGKDAERFLLEKRRIDEITSKIAEQVRRDPTSAKAIKRRSK